MPTSQFDERQIEQMRLMRENGFAFRVIGEKFGVGHDTIMFHLGLLKKSAKHYKTLKNAPKKKSPNPYYQRPATKVKTGLTYLDILKKQNFIGKYDKEGNLVKKIPKPPIK